MRDTKKYRIYRGCVTAGRWLLFAVVAFLILFPVYWIFISSITPPGELFPDTHSVSAKTSHAGKLSISD